MSGGQQPNPEPDRLLRLLMSSVSRRGLFHWAGKLGLSAVGAGVLAKVGIASPAVQDAQALGCPECTSHCDPCITDCHPTNGGACDVDCVCYCPNGCYNCIPIYFKAHLLWILGYIPNCTCVGCT
jgi:hypothetical protein